MCCFGWCMISGFAQEDELQPQLIKSVFFGGGSYYIDRLQMREVKEFLESVPDLKYYSIGISSHTDNIGGVEYNQWLSEQRSQSVIRLLKALEVPEDKIHKRDNGQENPLYDNNTWSGKRANRRVDIILTLIVF